jgi:hypothetical protein
MKSRTELVKSLDDARSPGRVAEVGDRSLVDRGGVLRKVCGSQRVV